MVDMLLIQPLQVKLARLLREGGTPGPAVIQNKFDLYHRGAQYAVNRSNLTQFIDEHGIVLDAYSPLSGWPYPPSPLDDPHAVAVAQQVGATPAQVLLRWLLQQGLTALVTSEKEKHLREATQVLSSFHLDADQMHHLSVTVGELLTSPLNMI